MSVQPFHPVKASNQKEEDTIPFPLEALNISQRRAVQAIAATFQQEPSLSGMSSLAGLAGAMGRAWKVTGASNLDAYGNLYLIAAAAPSYGKGASSEILRAIKQRNNELQMEYREQTLPELRVSLKLCEKQLKALYEQNNPNTEKLSTLEAEKEKLTRESNSPPALYVGSSTGAALVEALARNDEQIFSFSPEAGEAVHVALGKFSKDSKGDFDLMLSAFSVEEFSEARIGRGMKHLARPCISLCWLVQPSILHELLGNEEALQRGLAARCLYLLIEQQEIPIDDGKVSTLDRSLLSGWESILMRAMDRRNQPTETITCSAEARELFREFHNETVASRNGDYRDIQGQLGRMRENAIRIALGQCVADALDGDTLPSVLSADHARRGIALTRFGYAQFLAVLQPVREEMKLSRLNKLSELLTNAEGRKITLRDLERRNGFSQKEVEALAASYPHKLRISKVQTGGRPSPVLLIP